jgi:hypothetical protein
MVNFKSRLGRVASIVGALIAVGVLSLAAVPSASAAAPSQNLVPPRVCALGTVNGNYLTAVGGGGRTSDVLHTNATRVGAWEKFTLIDAGDSIHFGLRTSQGYFLTAVDSGGRTTDVIHSNATSLQGWEEFTFASVAGGGTNPGSIQALDGHFLTAVSGGGRTTDVIHSNATRVGSWERFNFICGV